MRRFNIIVFLTLALPLMAWSDSFTSLWKKVHEVHQKDLPKQEIVLLQRISAKAEKCKNYGQLLSAELARTQVEFRVNGRDSLPSEIARIEAMEAKARKHDGVLAAICQSVLGRLYGGASDIPGNKEKSKEYYHRSMSSPALLARCSAGDYKPLYIEGIDSRIFKNDLLHVIGVEAEDYKSLHDYYLRTGNRPAACICAYLLAKQQRPIEIKEARKSVYLHTIDSLINVYRDLPEAGELAIEHYQLITQAGDATPKDCMDYLNYALSRWGSWPRMNVLRNAQREITQPMFSLSVPKNMCLPYREQTIRLEHVRNLSEVNISITPLKLSGDTKWDPQVDKDMAQIRPLMVREKCRRWTRTYYGQPDYTLLTDSLILPGLPIGVYLIEVTTANKAVSPQRALYYVSHLAVLEQSEPNDSLHYMVVDATTGQPVPHARIRLELSKRYFDSAPIVQELTCDEKGETYLVGRSTWLNSLYVYTDSDKAFLPTTTDWPNRYYYRANEQINQKAQLYTDRALYRPGQTVKVAAILYKDIKGKRFPVLDHDSIRITMTDANYEEVASTTVQTDDYGTATCELTLPVGALTGTYHLRTGVGNAYRTIKVEEYRRPTFEVKLPEVNQVYHPGDTLCLKASAQGYTGVPIQGGKVVYQVLRCSMFGYRSFFSERDQQSVFADSTNTDENGNFMVYLPLILEHTAEKEPWLYRFELTATVTNSSGESHEAVLSLPLSTRPALLSVDLPDKSVADSLQSFTFNYVNSAGHPISSTVHYRFDTMSVQQVATNTRLNMPQLPSGKHILEAWCGEDTLRQEVVIFRMTDQRPVVDTPDWFYQSSNTFPTDGHPVYIQVGSTDADQYIYYTVFAKQRVIERGVIRQSNALTTQQFVARPEYGDGLKVIYAWVKNGEAHIHEATIAIPAPDKRIMLSWTTFRDHLQPGSNEQWTLRMTYPDGRPAHGQLMATLYDKSLDQLVRHSWNLSLPFVTSLPSTSCNSNFKWLSSLDLAATAPQRYFDTRDLQLTTLDDRYFTDDGRYPYVVLNALEGRVAGLSMGNRKLRIRGSKAVAMDTSSIDLREVALPKLESEESELANSAVESQPITTSSSLRRQFQETAFFMPALLPDAHGSISLRFTLPEGLTTWRFLGLAHDKAMNFGLLEGESVAQKIVSIQPYLPRFLRRGDGAMIKATVANSTTKVVNGTARLELIDPVNGAVVQRQTATYRLLAGQTGTVSFLLKATEQLTSPLYICRVMAEGAGYSDGEQHYLPILSDEELVTATYAFTQNKPGSLTVPLTDLTGSSLSSNNQGKIRYTVEYTNNPSWLMIQALPTVANPSEDNAVSLAAAFYANSLASNLLHRYPHISKVIHLWQQAQQQTGDKQSSPLASALEAQPELKQLLLNNTPWVLDADREAAAKAQLIDYFDSTLVQQRLQHDLRQLSLLQNPDGSWSWWPGMLGSSYMTTAICKILTRLDRQIGEQSDTHGLLLRAMKYLDEQAGKEVKALKEAENKHQMLLRPTEQAVDYLYICALSGRKLSLQAQRNHDYLLQLLSRHYTDLTIYGKAHTAVIMARNGKKQVATTHLQSIREYTVYREEMGRYFDTPKAPYSWCDYRIPTQVAAIEALYLLQPADTLIRQQMQRWLLQSKRTQLWSNPLIAVDAVYAFSLAHANYEPSLPSPMLRIDGKALPITAVNDGLGTVRHVFTDGVHRSLTVERTAPGTGWGAVYAQFMQPISDIEAASAGFSIQREVLPAGVQHTATGTKAYRVGDRVKVRLTIKAERDYDFVTIVDHRAACLEPVQPLSGYRNGYYCTPRDQQTNYYFDQMSKGTHVVETEYFVDREGDYQAGTCMVQCAYSPAYTGRTSGMRLTINQ